MKNGLELTTRLSTDSEFKSLYSWSLQEYDAEGAAVGRPVIPWTFSFYFQVRQIERVHAVQSSSYPEGKPVSETDSLRCGLVSVRGEFDRPVKFSIFGTHRCIQDLKLEIFRLQDSEAEERCEVDAFPEFLYEPEFPTIPSTISPDALSFAIYLSSERYERLLETLGSDPNAELGLMVRGVSGFYAGWSPDIVTSFVKVLPPGSDFEPEAPEGTEIRAPTTGTAKDFAITAQRVMRPEPTAEPEHNDWEGEDVARPLPKTEAPIGGAILKQLNQLKSVLWGVATLLLLILLFKH